MNIKKFLPVIGFALLILLLVVVVQSFGGNKSTNNLLPEYGVQEENRQQNDTQPTNTNTSTTPVVQNTGGKLPTHTKEEAVSINQFQDLRLKLPIDTTNFAMSKFNFDTFKIVVTFKNNVIENKQQLLEQWLNENGYNNVDRNYFDLK